MEKENNEDSGAVAGLGASSNTDSNKSKAINVVGIRSAFTSLLVIIVAVGFILAAVSFVLQQQNSSSLQTRLAENSARLIANSISNRAGIYQDFALMLSKSQQALKLLKSKDVAGVMSLGDQYALSGQVLKVRFLPKDHSETDSDEIVPLSYSGLDLKNRAIRSGNVTKVELHAPNSPRQHIAVAAPVKNAEGKGLGAVHVAFSIDSLNELIKSSNAPVLLRQKSGENKIEMGRSSSYQSEEEGAVGIDGTSWELAYHDSSVMSLFEMALVAIVIVVATLVVGALLFLKQIQLRKALAHDKEIIIELVTNKLQGKTKNLIGNIALIEHRELFKELANLDSQGALEKASKKSKSSGKTDGKDSAGEEPSKPGFPSSVSQSEGAAADVADIESANVSEDIFREYDIRGIVGDTLSLEHAYVIGKAIGSMAIDRGENDMLVAYDGRVSSKDLSSTLIRGLCESGINVTELGLMPTPVMYFGTNFLSARSGVMVTGSHNPPEYNGFKVVIGGNALSGDDIQGIHTRIVTGRFNNGEGSHQKQDISADYIKRISEDVQMLKPMKIVVDCGHGVASVVARQLFEALGCEVVSQYCEVDGNFPAHHPDPGNPENLAELAESVQTEEADLGIAFDGDGDRLGVVDSKGKIINADRVLMVLAADLLLRNPGADILYDVKCTKSLAAHVLSSGGRPIMWKSGHSLMKQKMRETGALLGDEFSGHIFFAERWYGFDDALYAAARLLEVISGDGRSSADMFAEIPDTMNTPELMLSVSEGVQHQVMDKIMAAADKAFPNAKITDIDGVRAEYPGGWGLVRASNTTPGLVFRFEADNEEAMGKVQDIFRAVVKAVLPNATPPF